MASVNISEGQSMFDLAIQKLGSCEAAFELALENGLSFTDELTPGTTIQLIGIKNKAVADYFNGKGIAPATYAESPSSQIENIEVIYWSNDFEEVRGMRVSERQSIYDIAIQLGGDLEAVMELALINGLSITDELSAGQLVQVPEILNADTVNYFQLKGIVPETAGIEIDESLPILEGIGYWAIDVDFVVS